MAELVQHRDNKEIQRWIDDYQKGRAGIYPHHVAVATAEAFSIPVSVARQHVLTHIHRVMSETEREGS